jgi:putative RNA 2'-phosphotransferase
MDDQRLKKVGRYMSLLLRHSPEKEFLSMDKFGYVPINQLCNKLNITREELDNIVSTNNKKRFSYSDDDQFIRATQGHSFQVELGYDPIIPPSTLYHGTTIDNKKSILKDGLLKMNRQHVHLTSDLETAKQVGMRYAKTSDKLWLIQIDASQMFKDDLVFYLSTNNVYLIDKVPSIYVKNYES